MNFPKCTLHLVNFQRRVFVSQMIAFVVVCHGLQEIIPANVSLRHVIGGKRTQFRSTTGTVNLFVSIHTPYTSFHFRLTPIEGRHTDVPVYLQGNVTTFRIPNSTRMDYKLYKDTRRRAWFSLHPGSNTPTSRVTGIFSSRGFLYTLRRNTTKKDASGYILICKEATLPSYHIKPNFNHTGVEELPWIDLPFRNVKKRQVILYEIELILAIDYSVFKVWSQGNHENLPDNDETILKDIKAHYILLVHGINSRFETIRGHNYAVEVCLVGIYVANSSATNPWLYTTSNIQHNSERPVLPSDAMSLFANWVKQQRDQLPNYDHAMAFTADNLAHKENLNTLGVASQQSMCTDRSLSIIEDHGNIAYASFVAAHELAHSLGAKHDGQPPTVKYKNRIETCQENDNYIMSPKATSTPKTDDKDRSWKFSKCSQLYFDFYIDHLNSVNNNCLLHSDIHQTSGLTLAQTSTIAYSPDVQCTRINGEGSVLNRDIAVKNPHDICRSIPCTQPRDNILDSDWLNILSMEGTVCDKGMVCQRGRCVQTTENSTETLTGLASEKCIFGDQPGKIYMTQMSCSELIQGKPHNCYRFENVCCSTCRQHLRQQSIVFNCSYGDHVADCDWTMCNSECCETCALHQGVFAHCPDVEHHGLLRSSTNTKSYHHGTVMSFSCGGSHSLDGSEKITCMQNGTWSGEAPTCYRGCPQFQGTSAISISLSTGNYSFGTLAHFRCLHGLALIGNSTALCMSTSRWNTSAPSCLLQFSTPDSISVAENIRDGTTVHRLSTGHAQSDFEMIAMSHPGFKVDQSGKVMVDVSMEIDYEQIQLYRLYIRATLAADPRFRASQVLQIKIEDSNEYAPVFERPVYRITVPTDILPGETLVQVRANDDDLSTPELTYSIIETDLDKYGHLISINSTSGKISLKSDSSFMNAFEDDIYLTIHAVDGGLPEPKTGSTLLKICVDTVCSGKSTISLELSLFLALTIHFQI